MAEKVLRYKYEVHLSPVSEFIVYCVDPMN